MASSGGGKWAAAVALVPVAVVGMVLSVVFVFDTTASAACNPSGSAVVVDPGSVPQGPVAGYSGVQLVNAAHVMVAARGLGLTVRDQQIGVMTAMGESGLRILDFGDAAGPDSRGLFQQRTNGAWGSLADRMDPAISSTNFFTALSRITERESLAPTLVAHQVQRNADPYYYEPFWAPAAQVVQALAGVQTGNGTATTGGQPSAESVYDLGPVAPQTAVVANTLGPMFDVAVVGGFRPGDPQDHGVGLALDFMVDRATGDALAAYAQGQAGALGVKYLIWYQRIWSPERADEGWRPMADRGSPTQNHLDHVHVSLTGAAAGDGGASPCAGQAGVGPVSLSGWAAPAGGPITSGYGPRSSPGGVGSTWHRGLDFGPGCDAPIWSANDGVVASAGPASGFGNLIEVDHGQGVVTRYGHMYDNGVLVRTGDRVSAGQQIGQVGSNGNSTGCHLHFEVQRDGDYVDPQGFLGQVGVQISN